MVVGEEQEQIFTFLYTFFIPQSDLDFSNRSQADDFVSRSVATSTWSNEHLTTFTALECKHTIYRWKDRSIRTIRKARYKNAHKAEKEKTERRPGREETWKQFWENRRALLTVAARAEGSKIVVPCDWSLMPIRLVA